MICEQDYNVLKKKLNKFLTEIKEKNWKLGNTKYATCCGPFSHSYVIWFTAMVTYEEQ